MYRMSEMSMKKRNREIIAALLGQMQERHQKLRVAFNTNHPRSRSAGRCDCGKCKACEDNARWERIFNEKFADPDYYTTRHLTLGSSLAKR